MSTKCIHIGCPRDPEFSCACDQDLRACPDHMFDHLKEPGNHSVIFLNSLNLELQSKIEKGLKADGEKNLRLYAQAEAKFKEIIEILKDTSGEMLARQHKLLILSNRVKIEPDIRGNIEKILQEASGFDVDKIFNEKLRDSQFDKKKFELMVNLLGRISKDLRYGNQVIEKVVSEDKYKDLSQRINRLEKDNLRDLVNNVQGRLHFQMNENKAKDAELSLKIFELEQQRKKDVDRVNQIENRVVMISNQCISTGQETKKIIDEIVQTLQAEITDKFEKSLETCDQNFKQIRNEYDKIQRQIKEFSNSIVGFNNIIVQERSERERNEKEKRERIAKKFREREIEKERIERERLERERIEEAKTEKERIERERKEFEPLVNEIETLKIRVEQLRSELSSAKSQIESHLQKQIQGGITERSVIEGLCKSAVESIQIAEALISQSNQLQNIKIFDELETFKHNCINSITFLEEKKKVCNGFLDLFDWLNGYWKDYGFYYNPKYFRSIRLTNDKNYFFYCK